MYYLTWRRYVVSITSRTASTVRPFAHSKGNRIIIRVQWERRRPRVRERKILFGFPVFARCCSSCVLHYGWIVGNEIKSDRGSHLRADSHDAQTAHAEQTENRRTTFTRALLCSIRATSNRCVYDKYNKNDYHPVWRLPRWRPSVSCLVDILFVITAEHEY